jgi:hypothetical protein
MLLGPCGFGYEQIPECQAKGSTEAEFSYFGEHLRAPK